MDGKFCWKQGVASSLGSDTLKVFPNNLSDSIKADSPFLAKPAAKVILF